LAGQSPQGDRSRPWADRRPSGQETPRPQSPSSGWSPRQGGSRSPSPQSGWSPGLGGPRLRPSAQGNTGNWRPGWRSPSGDRGGQPPVQRQYPPEQRAGVRVRPINRRRLLLLCRRIAPDVAPVASKGATLTFTGVDVTSAGIRDVTRCSTGLIPEQLPSRRCRTFRTDQQVQLRDQPGMQPIRSQTGSGARTRASGPRRPVFLNALSRIRRSLCLR